MCSAESRSSCVVVGIDGSRAALDAALWAVDEAVDRDIPLRLMYAVTPRPRCRVDAREAAHDLATAEIAVRYAVTAVESTDSPVKIEVEILQDNPARALLAAAGQAAILVVGAHGLDLSRRSRIGPVAAAVATYAVCPVAVIRSYDPNPGQRRGVVAEVDETPAACNIVVARAVEEARLRKLPLTVITTWQSRFTDVHDCHAVSKGNRIAKARLDRHVAAWRRRNPDVSIQTKAVHGSTSQYLAANAESIQLLVVDKPLARGFNALMGRPGYAAVAEADCSVLICEPQNVS
ncbi:MAG: universal stress protein [Mycolicibacterium mageritense]|uniref:Universal stress protein n=1 Tax=Mycolicibacterium mageritense TaxID=53462 RepID=A0AAI8U0J7_MYCME|nr:MAG: universal stress protein [Mycolicibacterium mageritense]BDY32296.1 Universal stress protein [Mycolicibacterium mageritense]